MMKPWKQLWKSSKKVASKILPVLQNGKLIGLISKQFVLIKYSEKLKEMVIE